MPRVKGGTTARKRRKKILKLAKGYKGSRSLLYRTAHEQVMKSLQYSYRDRKVRKREFRKLWISRINAAAKLNGFKYSKLIHGLALANVKVNRKMLSEIAIHAPQDFTQYVTIAKNAIEGVIAKPAKVEAKEVKEVVKPKTKVVETVEKVVTAETTETVKATPKAVQAKKAPAVKVVEEAVVEKKTTVKKTVAKSDDVVEVKKAAPKKTVAKSVDEVEVKKAAPKKTTTKKTE
jgi:large subunit ribosomal protein L20